VRVWLCFGVVVWFFGAVFGWAFGCQRACGVCSRLLEMADFRPSPRAGRESWLLPRPRGRLGGGHVEKPTQRRLPTAWAKFMKTSATEPPSLRFLLHAGGTAWTRGSVPLAKRGEPKGGGQFINSERAIGIIHHHLIGQSDAIVFWSARGMVRPCKESRREDTP
jgi:hypothetical protein